MTEPDDPQPCCPTCGSFTNTALGNQVQDMAMLIRQMSYWLNKAMPKHTLCYKAEDYLKRKGLEPKLLHGEPEY
jgi:hypothetical protein